MDKTEPKEENIVKKTCKELGITQKELAELMGVNDGTPAQWSSKGDIPDMAQRFMTTLIKNKQYNDKLNNVTNALKILDQLKGS
ncbi:MAG: helix-turn-helix transcriptional regulator [Campylobacterota bacterium]|nr:helix-turn-helix transcriptional regulator [Campylobacterota bacterium]